MADPGSLSASFAQITTTAGLGTYTLDKTIRDKLPISDGYVTGDTLTYHVTDASGQMEITTGTFTTPPDMLTRDTLVLSSTGSFIDWPTTGQRIVTPITNGIPICDTPPINGQVLIWDSMIMKWCPGDVTASGLPLCDTVATDGQDLVWDGVNNEWCPDQRVIGRPADMGSGNSGALTKIHGGLGDGAGDGGGVEVLGGVRGGSGFSTNGTALVAAGDNNVGDASLTLLGLDNFGDGGNATLASGQTGLGGSPGNITIQAGDDLVNLVGAEGGNISLFAGGVQQGDGLAGKIEIHAGPNFVSGDGGQLILGSGSASMGDAGNTSINAGSGGLSSGSGGGISLTPGPGGNSGGIGSGGGGGDLEMSTGNGGTPNGVAGDMVHIIGTGVGTGRDGLFIILRPGVGAPIGLPTSDPGIRGALWSNSGVVTISL